MVLEVNDAGELVLPAELVQAPPHTQLQADRQGEAVVLKPVASPTERPSILSLPTYPSGPVDPHMTFRREDIYDDDGR